MIFPLAIGELVCTNNDLRFVKLESKDIMGFIQGFVYSRASSPFFYPVTNSIVDYGNLYKQYKNIYGMDLYICTILVS